MQTPNSIEPVRQLLPFEVALCRELGISRTEYLEFLAEQQRHGAPQFNGPVAGPQAVPIILAVVGLIFQIVGLLLRPAAPRPQTTSPEAPTREQRFAPTFGFNSVQELARYGEPVNLIYTSRTDNPKGGVRTNGSLVWSNVLSFGSSQFYQALLVLGAGELVEIDAAKTGFGQSLVSQQPVSRTWQYFRNGSTTGNNQPVSSDVLNTGNTSTDPGLGSTYVYEVRNGAGTSAAGFSQAFSPTAANALGVYAPIPINVKVRVQNPSDTDPSQLVTEKVDVGITSSVEWSVNGSVTAGATLTLTIYSTQSTPTNDADRAAQDIRIAAAQGVNSGVIYRLGSSEWEFTGYGNGSVTDPVDGFVTLNFRCVKNGRYPTAAYVGDVEFQSLGWVFTKAFLRQEIAEYKTVNKCDIIDFAFKGKVFRNISGRSKPNYSTGQNGYKNRQAFFFVEYKKRSESQYTRVPGVFVVRRAADADNFFYLKFKAASRDLYDFRFVPTGDVPAEVPLFTQSINLYYIANGGSAISIQSGSDTWYCQGITRGSSSLLNVTPPLSTEWDLFSLDSITSYRLSCDSGPELAINVVNEQQIESRTALYDRLALLGVNLYSGRNIQDVRQISAFVNKGKKVRRINTGSGTWPSTPDGASSYAPDIFLDTILDDLNGVGGLVPSEAIDVASLIKAKKFCVTNNLFFDGVIADNQNWRQFWADRAPFSLLEFTRINGKEGLIPAVPTTADGAITTGITISEMFNEGNILEGSYREEFLDFGDNTKDIEATVIYRSLDDKAFPVQMSVIITRSDAVNPLPQSFDLSSLVTTREHAVLFGKLLCNVRRYQRRGVEFKTVPTETAVAPGDYIRIETRMTIWDTIYTGRVSTGGTLVPVTAMVDGTYEILLYRSGSAAIRQAITIAAGQGAVDEAYSGWLFVLGRNIATGRVFRVSETTTDEEGIISVKATEYPCDQNGNALIPDFSNNLFTVLG